MNGERCEALAFTFCKCATLVLLTGVYALPIAAIGCSVFYVMAHFKGCKETRCVFRYPLLVAAFWAVVATISISKMVG